MTRVDATLRLIGPAEAARVGRSRIRGELVNAGTERIQASPFDATLRGPILEASAREVDLAVEAAARGARAMAAMPIHARVAIVERLAALVERDAERLAATMTWQTGKPLRETRRETARAADTLRFSARAAELLAGEQVLTDTTPAGQSLWAYTHRRPLGIVVAITPFNAPLNLLAHKLGPALVGGNAIIVKPASAAPVTAAQLVELSLAAGVPPEAVGLVIGTADLALALVGSPRVAAVTFTGGRVAAEAIWHAAPMKRLVLELGGNSANIIFDDADLPAAVAECVRGAYSNSGQSCNSVQRIIAPASIADELVAALAERVASLRVGDPFAVDTDIGSMVSEQDARRVCDWTDEAVEAGALAVTGGTRSGATLLPTLLTRGRPGMRVVDEEIFGPVAVVLSYGDDDEAFEIANQTTYGLQFGVFTRSLERALRAASEMEAGSVLINRSSNFRLDSFVYGGVKNSGVGREDPRSTLRELTEEHFVVFGPQP